MGFEEAKDFVFLGIKDYLKNAPKQINLVKESEKECGIACIYEVEGKKYLVRGEDESTDIIVPAGEISDSDLTEILEQGYEGREKKSREWLNEKNKNILDSTSAGAKLGGSLMSDEGIKKLASGKDKKAIGMQKNKANAIVTDLEQSQEMQKDTSEISLNDG